MLRHRRGASLQVLSCRTQGADAGADGRGRPAARQPELTVQPRAVARALAPLLPRRLGEAGQGGRGVQRTCCSSVRRGGVAALEGRGWQGERVPAGSALAFLCRVLAGRPHRDPLRCLGVGLGHPLILSEHPRTCLGSRPREPGRVLRALRALSGVLSGVPAHSRARGCRPRAGRGQTPPGAAAGRPGRAQRRDGVLRVPGVLAADAVEPSPQRGR